MALRQGLNTDEQRKAAEAWIKGQIAKAQSDLQNPPNIQGFLTVQDYEQAVQDMRANPFYDKVEKIEAFAKADATNYQAKKVAGLAKLTEDSVKAMVAGKKRDGVMEVFSKSFTGFELRDPFGSISRMISGTIQGIAMLLGGDMAAPYIESVKSRIFGPKAISAKEAEDMLRYSNGAEALAEGLGLAGAARESFIASATAQVEGIARNGPPQAPVQTPAPSAQPPATATAMPTPQPAAFRAATPPAPDCPDFQQIKTAAEKYLKDATKAGQALLNAALQFDSSAFATNLFKPPTTTPPPAAKSQTQSK